MAEAVLIISNVAWDFVWQRHQTMAALWAREHDVVYCEIPGVRGVGWADLGRVCARLSTLFRPVGSANERPARLRLLRPLVLPATNAVFCAFNAWQMRRLVRRDPGLRAGVGLIMNYSTSRTALRLIELVRHERLVYDCTDDLLEVKGAPAFMAGDERQLLARADLTLVPSRVLLERKSPFARRCVRLSHGALVARFLSEPKAPPEPGRLTLLYYGHLHRQHLDFVLLDGMARARPDWRIILVGPVRSAHGWPPNVELTGQQPHENLRAFVARADVLLLPYVVNDYTRAVLPAKTYECLATGRPILAAPLPELVTEFSRHMAFPEGVDGWIRAAETVVQIDTPARRENRIALARANSWAARFAQMQALLAEHPTP